MEYEIKSNRLYINYDEGTKLEFELDELKSKIDKIPSDYMPSEEKEDLEKKLKEDGII